MNSILRGLYLGKVIAWERPDPLSEKHLETIRRMEAEEQYFLAKLSREDGERFRTLSRMQGELLSENEDNLFAYGFSLGLLLMLDVAEQAKLIMGK